VSSLFSVFVQTCVLFVSKCKLAVFLSFLCSLVWSLVTLIGLLAEGVFKPELFLPEECTMAQPKVFRS